MDRSTVDRLSADPLVRAVIPHGARLKLSSPLAGGRSRAAQRPQAHGFPLSIGLFADVDPGGVAAAVEALGARHVGVNDDGSVGGGVVIVCVVPDWESVVRISALEEVRSVEEVAERVEDNRAAAMIQSGAPDDFVVWDQRLHGEGQVLGIIDKGPPDVTHCFFEDLNVPGNAPGPAHRKILAIRNILGTNASEHATLVAGCAAGDDHNRPGAGVNRGGAWAATLVCGDFNVIPGLASMPPQLTRSTLAELTDAAAAGAHIHSNSWHDNTAGVGQRATYNQIAVDVDTFTWTNEAHLVLGSAGNKGEEQGPPGTAKNAICVAAAKAHPDEMEYGDGNPGPTADERRKPDVMGVGCGIISAAIGTGCGVHTPDCGASLATAHVAAAAALTRQYFTEGRYPTGLPRAEDAFTPSGALLKAVLVNSAVDMTGVPGYPNDIEGWGLIRLGEALYFPGNARNLAVWDKRHAGGVTTGVVEEHHVEVVDGTRPLKVVLAWSDPPAALNSNPSAVNNLDLQVVSPDGTQTFLGNWFQDGKSVTGGATDQVNNVEVVLIDQPAVGTWTVRVMGSAVNVVHVDRPGQGYAVAVTGDLASPDDLDFLNACVSLLLLGDGDASALPAPAADEISHRPGTVLAGATSFGQITLASPAPPEGKVVQFTSSQPDLVRVPNVQVPAGQSQGTFALHVAAAAAGATVELTAQTDVTKRARLTVPTQGIRTVALGTQQGHRPAVFGAATGTGVVYATHYLARDDNLNDSFGPGELVVIDASTLTEVSRVPVGLQPRSVAVNPHTGRIYVANRTGHSVSLLDGANPTKPREIARVEVGQSPVDVAVNATTGRVFVANPLGRKIHVLDGASGAELATINTGPGLTGLAADEETNRLYATHTHKAAGAPVRTLTVIQGADDGSFQLLPPVPVGVEGNQPVDVAVNGPAGRIYLACLGGSGAPPALAVLHRGTLAPRALVRMPANPHALAVDAGRNQVYVGTDAGLHILDGATDTMVITALKTAVRAVTVDPVTGQVFYGSAVDDLVSAVPVPNLTAVMQWI